MGTDKTKPSDTGEVTTTKMGASPAAERRPYLFVLSQDMGAVRYLHLRFSSLTNVVHVTSERMLQSLEPGDVVVLDTQTQPLPMARVPALVSGQVVYQWGGSSSIVHGSIQVPMETSVKELAELLSPLLTD